ncbi:MAG TPA: response regulator [Armatimonadota bacterium]|nr:response regulator [Armatimonadota bacterium]HOM81818.1 response regulator [Armatimonadota bacterium]HPO74868.1 response regulator [Armatimonadota bacterium]HPT98108.1 response regulator [Armatimonadota bacterium]
MNQRILVVDDELGPRESFRMLLKDRFEVHTAASGEECLASIREQEYALVFLDVRMPGMDGIETLARLRQLRPTLPVVIVTAYTTMEAASRAVEMGAFGSLIKPFTRRDVERYVGLALAAGTAEADAPHR